MAQLRGGSTAGGYPIFTTKGGVLSGNLIIAGTAQANGAFYAGTTNPSDSTRLNYNGYLYATKVYNAVYNDIADFFEVAPDGVVEFGKVYVREQDGTVRLSNAYCELGIIGIASDTYGMGIGTGRNPEPRKIPIAIGGLVLAHVDKEYPTGTPLTSGPGGTLTEIAMQEKHDYPERIIATYYKSESTETGEGVVVNGRHGVKIK